MGRVSLSTLLLLFSPLLFPFSLPILHFLLLLPFWATLEAYGGSQARDGFWASAVTYATGQGLNLHCLRDSARYLIHWTTVGILSFVLLFQDCFLILGPLRSNINFRMIFFFIFAKLSFITQKDPIKKLNVFNEFSWMLKLQLHFKGIIMMQRIKTFKHDRFIVQQMVDWRIKIILVDKF